LTGGLHDFSPVVFRVNESCFLADRLPYRDGTHLGEQTCLWNSAHSSAEIERDMYGVWLTIELVVHVDNTHRLFWMTFEIAFFPNDFFVSGHLGRVTIALIPDSR
jgi:hypothetical protein